MDLVDDTGERERSRAGVPERASARAFLGVCALAFAASVAVTVAWGNAMATMAVMAMPGGWAMSMAWMRLPGQSWPGAATSFLAMWLVMMIPMMLPSLVPMLCRYRDAVGRTRDVQLARLTAVVAVGYFLVWTLFGLAVFPLGVTLATLAMDVPAVSRGVPFAVAGVVLVAGALQFTEWKQRALACCRDVATCGGVMPPESGAAWRHGVRLGLHCARCCSGLMAILLVVDVMDPRVMTVITIAITVERLAAAPMVVARAIGVAALGAASYLLARAIGLV